MKTPEEWMRDFEAKIADAQAKAAAVQEGLAQAGGSASSKDGTIILSVAPNGALTGLELTADKSISVTAFRNQLKAIHQWGVQRPADLTAVQ